jgi:uncharacterized damage-inducible protein DinB
MPAGEAMAERAIEWSALTTLLEQLRDVLTLMPVEVYRARPAARVSGSVGAHVRHTLDHVSSLLVALEGGELQYDHRARGTLLEVEPSTAVSEIERLLFRLDLISAGSAERAVTFPTLITPERPATLVRSTLARELAFVIQHTIHHCALIALLLEWQGVRTPYGFGLAASTQRARVLAS